MNILVKYTFWPNSVKGLNTYVTVNAHSYVEAKERVLKWVYAHTERKHEIEQPENQWGVYTNEIL